MSPKISPATMSVLGSISIVLAFGRKLTESNVFVHVVVFLAARNIEIIKYFLSSGNDNYYLITFFAIVVDKHRMWIHANVVYIFVIQREIEKNQ